MARTRVHKRFFKLPTKAEIKERVQDRVHPNDPGLVDRLLNLAEDETLILESPMIPVNWRTNAGRYFLKNPENDVKASWDHHVRSIITRRAIPLDFRRAMFERERKGAFRPRSGYSFVPLRPWFTTDDRVRRVSLIECLEGARMSAYVEQEIMVPPIEIKEYLNAQKVLTEGAVIPMRVPSRSKGFSRYEFQFESVVVNQRRSPQEWRKYGIGWRVKTEGHNCQRKRWWINYKGGTSSREFVYCAHEIAGYREFSRRQWSKNKNPMVMSQFVQPTDLLIKLYKRGLDSVLVFDEQLSSKDKLRPMSKADLEILGWRLNYQEGHDKVAYREKKDGPLEQVDWSLRYVA
jgi:hypothetical protein